jgi:hypothetical protein
MDNLRNKNFFKVGSSREIMRCGMEEFLDPKLLTHVADGINEKIVERMWHSIGEKILIRSKRIVYSERIREEV